VVPDVPEKCIALILKGLVNKEEGQNQLHGEE
jgi:hypothetical protein